MNESDAQKQQQQAQQAEALKRVLFMRILDDGARRRLNNIRVANPHFAQQLEMALLQYAQSGVTHIDEKTLVTLAGKLTPPKRKTSILRR